MDPLIGAALISGGASLASGLFGSSSASKSAQNNVKLQKEFAQKGIQWKVQDARAAGIHPLAALGTAVMPFQSQTNPNNYDFLKDMGQDIGRAIAAKQTPEQKLATRMSLEESASRSDLYRAQAAALRTAAGKDAGTPPGSPSNLTRDGVLSGAAHSQGAFPDVTYKKPEKSIQKSPGIEGGREAMFREVNFPDSTVSLEITESIQDALSEGIIGNFRQIGIFAEQLVNDLTPSRTGLKPGHKWKSMLTPSGIRFKQVKVKPWTNPKDHNAYLYSIHHESRKRKGNARRNRIKKQINRTTWPKFR